MRRSLSITMILVFCLVCHAAARQGAPPLSAQRQMLSLEAIAVVKLPGLNTQALRAKARSTTKPGPTKFAQPIEVEISPHTAGTWESLPEGGKLWRLRIHAPGATSLNFGFTTYWLPLGATLHISSTSESDYEGPYTHKDNKKHHQLWTPFIPGDSAVIELFVPQGAKPPHLQLRQIGQGFRDFFNRQPPTPKTQGSCNIDVVCPEAEPWRDQIRSVALYMVDGTFFCSGQMIMDVARSFRPFFLTSHHCGITLDTAPSVVVYWNYQSPICGALSGGLLTDTQTGAILRFDRTDADVTLIELDEVPDALFNVFYSGWDRSGIPPLSSAGIHHPDAAEKAISFNDNPLQTTDSCIGSGGIDSHWLVDNWEQGTTEPGSSGSGLWDSDTQRLVGVLSGGSASCFNPLGSDCYGKLSAAWSHDDPNGQSLQDWLDPQNQEDQVVDGAYADGRSSDPPLALDIPDNQPDGVSHTREITQATQIAALRVRVQIAHTHVGDLQIKLRSPAGTEVVLLDQPGAPASRSGCADNNLDVTFDDMHATHLETHCNGTTPWYRGVAQPSTSLAEFAGEASQGNWTLIVSDLAGKDVGQLNHWDLTIIDQLTLPLPIPDNDPAGLVYTQELTRDVEITDIGVQVVIDHGHIGDLRIVLQSPTGIRTVLLDQPGVPADQFGCGDANLNITFSNNSTIDLDMHCVGTDPWYAGTALPVDSLSTLTGKRSPGIWTLIVSDLAKKDQGHLIDWQLMITPAAALQ